MTEPVPLPGALDGLGERRSFAAIMPADGGPGEAATARVRILSAADFAGADVPERSFHVPGWIPARTITLLSGDGGAGKSLLSLMLAVSTVAAVPWLGAGAASGPVVYVSAEDDVDELHRRLVDITGGCKIPLGDLRGLTIIPLAGEDALLAVPHGRTGALAPTPLWREITTLVERERPALVVLDTAADFYGGNENDRAQVRQFIGMLRGLAIRSGAAVLLLSHPSLTGMSSGSGLSGSTAWNNSVRSRLYLSRPESEDGAPCDPDLRVLRAMKANYAPTGAEILIRWEGGRFVLEGLKGAGMFDRLAAENEAEAVFLSLVEAYASEGRAVRASTGHGYAPATFAKDARARGLPKKLLEGAMNRLFARNAIRVEEHGPPTRRYKRIVTVAQEAAE